MNFRTWKSVCSLKNHGIFRWQSIFRQRSQRMIVRDANIVFARDVKWCFRSGK